jgi:threonine dehydrogenase-like Zn-dependent dehydrogenase
MVMVISSPFSVYPYRREDVLITGAGPIGIIPAVVARQTRPLTDGNKSVTIILDDRAPRLH